MALRVGTMLNSIVSSQYTAVGCSGKTADTAAARNFCGEYQEENDRLLMNMQLAESKLEALGAYYGALQTASKECGSDGITLSKRVALLSNTAQSYQSTDDYKDKKDKDTFVSDQVEAMKESQEKLQEIKTKKAEKAKKEEKAKNKKTQKDKALQKDQPVYMEKETQKGREVHMGKKVQKEVPVDMYEDSKIKEKTNLEDTYINISV